MASFSAIFFAESGLDQRSEVRDQRSVIRGQRSEDRGRKTVVSDRASILRFFPGRISLETVWARLPTPITKVYYLSGPPVMLTALGADLRDRGVPSDRIRTDAWE